LAPRFEYLDEKVDVIDCDRKCNDTENVVTVPLLGEFVRNRQHMSECLNQMTTQMSGEEYGHFSQCRKGSLVDKKLAFGSWLGITKSISQKLHKFVWQFFSYLAWERLWIIVRVAKRIRAFKQVANEDHRLPLRYWEILNAIEIVNEYFPDKVVTNGLGNRKRKRVENS